MEVEGYSFPDDLYYDKEHCWCRVEGNVVVTGTTDFAQKMAGENGRGNRLRPTSVDW
jgi:glycine cleavage system H protein